MALPSSGAISFSQINTELGVSATATRSLNDSTTRTLFGVSSGQISMSQGYGKANQFSFTIASNQTNANLRTLAVNAGWNQTSKVVATINSGVTIYSTSTGTPALTINGSFPGGVQLNNNGVILGRGGAGGNPWGFGVVYAIPGGSGGLALSVSVAVSINNANRIAGGGGGGGGGAGYSYSSGGKSPIVVQEYGGGGGGGIGNGPGGSASAPSASAGSSGTLTSAGTGGAASSAPAGSGGNGGSYGAAGATGNNGGGGNIPASDGGAAGGAVAGNTNITWIATGTRNGGIS
jgi:hypothetical protein